MDHEATLKIKLVADASDVAPAVEHGIKDGLNAAIPKGGRSPKWGPVTARGADVEALKKLLGIGGSGGGGGNVRTAAPAAGQPNRGNPFASPWTTATAARLAGNPWTTAVGTTQFANFAVPPPLPAQPPAITKQQAAAAAKAHQTWIKSQNAWARTQAAAHKKAMANMPAIPPAWVQHFAKSPIGRMFGGKVGQLLMSGSGMGGTAGGRGGANALLGAIIGGGGGSLAGTIGQLVGAKHGAFAGVLARHVAGNAFAGLGMAHRGMGQAGHGMMFGNASGMISGGLGMLGGAASMVPVVGPVIRALTGVAQKIVGALDQMVGHFSKYNAKIAMAAGRYEIEQMKYNVKMGRAMEPMLTAWSDYKTEFTKAFSAFTPIIRMISQVFGKFLSMSSTWMKGMGEIFKSMTKGFVNMVTGIAWAVGQIREAIGHLPGVPSYVAADWDTTHRLIESELMGAGDKENRKGGDPFFKTFKSAVDHARSGPSSTRGGVAPGQQPGAAGGQQGQRGQQPGNPGGGQPPAPGAAPPAKGSAPFFGNGVIPEINQTVTMNLQAKISHEREVFEMIQAVRDKLLRGMSTARNEALLLRSALTADPALSM